MYSTSAHTKSKSNFALECKYISSAAGVKHSRKEKLPICCLVFLSPSWWLFSWWNFHSALPLSLMTLRHHAITALSSDTTFAPQHQCPLVLANYIKTNKPLISISRSVHIHLHPLVCMPTYYLGGWMHVQMSEF